METRRILLDGVPTTVSREGDELVAPDGRTMPLDDPIHLPPVMPTKVVCVHLNYESRRAEFQATLGPAPTYFHKPVSSLNAHGGEIVRPPRCRFLNYEGEIGIVIGERCRHIAPEEADAYIQGYTIGNDYGLHDFRDTDAGLDAAREGQRLALPARARARDRLGLPRQASADPRERRRRPGREHRRDDLGHALPGRRHRAHDHAGARRRDPVGHPGELAPGRARRRRGGRGRGPRRVCATRSWRARCRSATTSAPSRARARK